MSGAGTSRAGASKRQRVPQGRGQGNPITQEERDPRLRHIRYHTSERIPVCRVTRLRDHPVLQFDMNTKEWEKLGKLIDTELLEHRTIDWNWLGEMGARREVESLLGPRLIDALDCHWDQYEELVLEFHCTFKHKEGTFHERNAVSFSLGRMVHEMTIPQFAVASGLYTELEVTTPEFLTGLRGVYQTPRELSLGSADLERFWGDISDFAFTGTNLITSVRNPVYRYLLKIFASTIVGRKSGENKANWTDLFILLCLVEGRNMNLASVLAWSLGRSRRGGHRAALDMGPYIGRLAHNLGVYNKYNPQYLHKGPVSKHFPIRDLQLAGILTYDAPITWEAVRLGPQGQPPPGHPADDVMQATVPIHRQRPRQRHEIPAPQYPRRQPPPDPLTLESVYNRMDQGFSEMHDWVDRGFGEVHSRIDNNFGDLRGMIQAGQERHEGAMRYMMSQMSMNVPDFFRPQVPPPQDPFGFPGQYSSFGQGSSTQPAGQGSGSGQYVDPAPEFQIVGQDDEDEEEEEEDEEEEEEDDD